jgi:hypothetical protein
VLAVRDPRPDVHPTYTAAAPGMVLTLLTASAHSAAVASAPYGIDHSPILAQVGAGPVKAGTAWDPGQGERDSEPDPQARQAAPARA